MQLIRHCPSAPLDRYVERFWWSRREAPQDDWEHVLPSGTVQLIFALHETQIICLPHASANPIVWSGGLLHGPQGRYYIGGPKPSGAVVGVSFRPGGAGAVLGVPASALVDQHLALHALWGTRAEVLRERLLAAAAPPAVFQVLEQALSARIERPLLMHPMVAQALTSSWRKGVAQIQSESGYSSKHFIAVFSGSLGLTPKCYFRIRRFNEVLRRLATEPEAGLADVAACFGYADQAHLTREFRELAGITPRRYRPRGDASPLHHRATNASTGG